MILPAYPGKVPQTSPQKKKEIPKQKVLVKRPFGIFQRHVPQGHCSSTYPSNVMIQYGLIEGESGPNNHWKKGTSLKK